MNWKARQPRLGRNSTVGLQNKLRMLHKHLTARQKSFGFYKNSLNLVKDYWSFRKQSTKIDSSYSGWVDVRSGTSQGSILGSLLFHIHMYICIYIKDMQSYHIYFRFKVNFFIRLFSVNIRLFSVHPFMWWSLRDCVRFIINYKCIILYI